MIAPFRYRHRNFVKMKHRAPFQETVIAIVTLALLCFTGLGTYTSASLSLALSYDCICRVFFLPVLNCLIVHWERGCCEQTVQQWVNSQKAPAPWKVPSLASRDGSVSAASVWSRPCEATLSQDGVRPPPGRTLPEVLLSLPALQLSWQTYELLASLLTKSVQEARSAVSEGGRG